MANGHSKNSQSMKTIFNLFSYFGFYELFHAMQFCKIKFNRKLQSFTYDILFLCFYGGTLFFLIYLLKSSYLVVYA